MNATTFDEKRFAVLADCLAVALAASLPWSTSATAIIAGLWLLACMPTLDVQSFRRMLFIPAAALPVLFVMLGGLGMLWADVSWAERFDGIGSFIKFLFHTFASVQVLSVRSWTASADRLCGFLRCIANRLVVPLALARVALVGHRQISRHSGQRLYFAERNVHDLRLGHFAICIRYVANQPPPVSGGALHPRIGLSSKRVLRRNKPNLSPCHSRFADCVWLSDVRLERSGFVGCRNYPLAMAAWPSASSLRLRVSSFFDEVRAYQPTASPTPAGERLEFWRKSLGFIKEAPLFGHGTGSIRDQFRRSVAGQSGNGGGGCGQSAQSDASGRNSTRSCWHRGVAGNVDCTLGVIPI